MIKLLALMSLSSLSIFSSTAFAAKLVKQEFFKNRNCKKNNSCNLKSFSIKVYNTTSNNKNAYTKLSLSAGAMMEGSFQLKKRSAIREFAVVQYIKGCVYEKSTMGSDKEVIRSGSRRRDHYGEVIDFKHTKWEIDSFDDDPIYASDNNNRHGNYKVLSDESKSVLLDDRKYYTRMSENPALKRKPFLHFSDIPTGSSYRELEITGGANKGKIFKSEERASMVFKTCLFKTKDVPRDLPANNTDISKAIKCFDWSNSQKYNHKTQTFEQLDTVDLNCLSN